MNFKNIVELTTGVNDQVANNPTIYGDNGTLYIENTEVNNLVKVYETTGKIRYAGKMLNSSMMIELVKGSVYLLQINAKCYKVIL